MPSAGRFLIVYQFACLVFRLPNTAAGLSNSVTNPSSVAPLHFHFPDGCVPPLRSLATAEVQFTALAVGFHHGGFIQPDFKAAHPDAALRRRDLDGFTDAKSLVIDDDERSRRGARETFNHQFRPYRGRVGGAM